MLVEVVLTRLAAVVIPKAPVAGPALAAAATPPKAAGDGQAWLTGLPTPIQMVSSGAANAIRHKRMLMLSLSEPRTAYGQWRPIPGIPRRARQAGYGTGAAARVADGRHGHIRTGTWAKGSEWPAAAARTHAPSSEWLRGPGTDGASARSAASISPTSRTSFGTRLWSSGGRPRGGKLWASVSQHDNADKGPDGHAPRRSSYATG